MIQQSRFGWGSWSWYFACAVFVYHVALVDIQAQQGCVRRAHIALSTADSLLSVGDANMLSGQLAKGLENLRTASDSLRSIISDNACARSRRTDVIEWEELQRTSNRLNSIIKQWPVDSVGIALDPKSLPTVLSSSRCAVLRLNYLRKTPPHSAAASIAEGELHEKLDDLRDSLRLGVVDPLNAALCASGIRATSSESHVIASAFTPAFFLTVDHLRAEFVHSRSALERVLRSSSAQIFAHQGGGLGFRLTTAFPWNFDRTYIGIGATNLMVRPSTRQTVAAEFALGQRRGELLFDGAVAITRVHAGITVSASRYVGNRSLVGLRISSLSGAGIAIGGRF